MTRLTSYILITIGAVLFVVSAVFSAGKRAGQEKASLEFSRYIQEQQELVLETERKRSILEGELNAAIIKHSNELKDVKLYYEANMYLNAAEHSKRLQQLKTREDRYRQLSEATDADRRVLAELATELDRTLTEGRQLVGELRQELVLRNKQLEIIGAQFLAERKSRTKEAND